MRRMLIFFSNLIVFFLLLAGSPVLAGEEFEVGYDVRYEVIESGLTAVSQKITLTNKMADVYATQYSLNLQSANIENIRAEDSGVPLRTEVSQDSQQTLMTVFFNEPVVGKGKSLSFTLFYDAHGLAQKNGQIWEINIPRLSQLSQPDHFQLVLAVPQSFGNLAFIRPKPISQEEKDNLKLYRFDKNQVALAGISASFGEFQIFDFVLTYHLENPRSAKAETEIALPPDTSFQQTIFSQMEPEPVNVRRDNDGNWLAKYKLAAKEKLNVNVFGQAKIFAQPQENFFKPNQENLKNNLLAQKYWPVDNSQIQIQAQKFKTAKDVYDFVVEYLEYDFNRVHEDTKRFGALKALENPKKAICMEFTDLFITLARAAGIPAREINGFAYTTNAKLRPLSLVADILHAWPEYWDDQENLWRPVDPTWGKTTGGVDYFSKTDLNHFVFVIHGESDEQPYPPGSYKTSDSFGKDVQIVFGQYPKENKAQLEVDFNLPYSITIKNKGPTALYNLKSKINLIDSDTLIPLLPPFGQKEIKLELKPVKLLKLRPKEVLVTVNSQEFSQPLKISSFPWQIGLAGLGGIVILIVFLTRLLNYVKKIKAG